MQKKRVKAEHNLIKFKIISKLLKNEGLKENEKAYVQKWKSLDKSIYSHAFIETKVKDLSEKDRKSLNLVHSNLGLSEGVCLSDLVMELDNFVDKEMLNQI